MSPNGSKTRRPGRQVLARKSFISALNKDVAFTYANEMSSASRLLPGAWHHRGAGGA